MDPLDAVFYGNTVRAWSIAGVIFVVLLALLVALKGLLVRRLAKVAERTSTQLDDVVVELLRRVRLYFMAALALAAAHRALVLPDRIRQVLDLVSVLAFVLQIGAWGNGAINIAVHQWHARRGSDPADRTTIAAFGALARVVLWLVLLLVGLQNIGVNVTTLITGLGITGVAVALAVQNILGDLFAAMSIVVDKPFVAGQVIAVDDLVGTVEKVGLKTTRVRAPSGEQVIFSNADLLKSRLRNLSRMQERRVVLALGITYDTAHEQAERIPVLLREIIESVPGIRFERSHLMRLGESALEYETIYWVTTPDFVAYADAQQAVNLAILHRFAAEKLSFAFPTRTVVVQSLDGAAGAVAAAGAEP